MSKESPEDMIKRMTHEYLNYIVRPSIIGRTPELNYFIENYIKEQNKSLDKNKIDEFIIRNPKLVSILIECINKEPSCDDSHGTIRNALDKLSQIAPQEEKKDLYQIIISFLHRLGLNKSYSLNIAEMDENQIQEMIYLIADILFEDDLLDEPIKNNLNEYLDLLVTTNILFNSRKVKFEGYYNLDTMDSEDISQYTEQSIQSSDALKLPGIGRKIGASEEILEASSASASILIPSSSPAPKNQVFFSQSAYQIYDLQKLLAKLLEDKLYVFMNSSRNFNYLPEDRESVELYIHIAIEERNFKKLFCALCFYGGSFGELEERFGFKFPFEAFYYCYLTVMNYFPGYMDNFEKCDNLARSRHLINRRGILLTNTDGVPINKYYDKSCVTFQTFAKIYEALRDVLINNDTSSFLSLLLQHIETLQIKETDLGLALNSEFTSINHKIAQETRPPDEPVTMVLDLEKLETTPRKGLQGPGPYSPRGIGQVTSAPPSTLGSRTVSLNQSGPEYLNQSDPESGSESDPSEPILLWRALEKKKTEKSKKDEKKKLKKQKELEEVARRLLPVSEAQQKEEQNVIVGLNLDLPVEQQQVGVVPAEKKTRTAETRIKQQENPEDEKEPGSLNKRTRTTTNAQVVEEEQFFPPALAVGQQPFFPPAPPAEEEQFFPPALAAEEYIEDPGRGRPAETEFTEIDTREGKKPKGGRGTMVGGNCDQIAFRPGYNGDPPDLPIYLQIYRDIVLNLLQAKIELEASHDLKSERGKKSVTSSGENIFNVDGNDLYHKIAQVFSSIVDSIDPSTYLADTDLEKDFITKFKSISHSMDEPKYLATAIEAIMSNCPEKVNEFFYNPVIGFTLKDAGQKQALYTLLQAKIEQFYPISGWYLSMKTKTPGGQADLYLSITKRTTKEPNNTSLKLHEQDMGIGENLDMTLQEAAYNAAYNLAFSGAASNDINNFFNPGTKTLKPSYMAALQPATDQISSGLIEYDAATSQIKIAGSIQIIDVAKLMDPLNVEKPVHGIIIEPINISGVNKIKKLYIGYPNTIPLGAPVGATTSKTIFDNSVDALGIAPEIKTFLKTLNDLSVKATIDMINLLLGIWIETPGIDNYNFILNGQNQIIGIHFTSTTFSTFTFTIMIEDLTVQNICFKMITYFKNQVSPHPDPLIQQMNNVRAHPRYRYKPGNPAGINGMTADYGLAIIASFKSFGDEGQRASAEYLEKLITRIPNLSADSKKILLLSSDRPLVSQALLNFQPVIADLKRPPVGFGLVEDIPSGKIDDGIHSENGGLLSNAGSLISKTKSIIERLKDASKEMEDTILLLDTKTGPLVAGPPSPKPSDMQQSRAFKGQLDPIKLLANDAQRSQVENITDSALLKEIQKFTGQLKQVNLSLEYYNEKIQLPQPEDFSRADIRKQNDIIIGYIDDQIDNAISMSIDVETYKNLVAFNHNIGIHSRTHILDALRGMYDSIDFGPKLFDCHDIACEEVIKKIDMYIEIIRKDMIILPAGIKAKILEKYELLKEKIIILNDEFFDIVVKKLESDIQTKEKKQSLGDRGQKRQDVNADNPVIVLEAEKKRVESELASNQLRAKEIAEEAARLVKAKAEAEAEKTKAEEEKEKVTVAASKATKKEKGFFSQMASKAKEAFNASKNLIKEFDTSIKKAQAMGKQVLAETADKLKELQKIGDKLQKEVLLNLSKVHTKDPENAKKFLSLVENKWNKFRSSRGNVLDARGGKNKKTKQNKQKHHKKYTKRNNKKIYGKRSQKHLKIKRHKYTKKR